MSSKGKFISFYGILIKKNDFGEGNTMLTVLDREYGKLEIASFGSNREKSTRREALLITHVISGVCYRKNEESPPSLKEVKHELSFDGITSAFHKLSYIFLLFEALDIVLQKEEPFGLFPGLMEAVQKTDSLSDFEKYCFYFLVRLFKSEGLFPSFSRPEEYQVFLSGSRDPVNPGEGTIRFISDIERNDSPLFLENKKISPSVSRSMLDLISFIIKKNYNRALNSLSLIKLK